MDLIGVDIGGTKVSICLGDSEGNIHASKRVETSPLGGPETGLPKLVELIGHLIRDENIEIEELSLCLHYHPSVDSELIHEIDSITALTISLFNSKDVPFKVNFCKRYQMYPAMCL